MLLIRRLWLFPAFILTCLLYYLLHKNHSALQQPATPVPQSANGEPPFDWHNRAQHYPVTAFAPLPTGAAPSIPRIQHAFAATEDLVSRTHRLERRAAVKKTFVRSWTAYKNHAWRKDELSPISRRGRTTFGGWGATLVDAMDTLWIMGLKDDFQLCVKAVKAIDFSANEEGTLNVFETTIRYLGGLLAAYDLSNGDYPVLLEKAAELGEVLYAAFDSPHRMPMMRWQWRESAHGAELSTPSTTLLAEVGSLTLEFTRLAQLTGEPRYYDAIDRITSELNRTQELTALPGLWPTSINLQDWPITAKSTRFTMGGMADSTYEYLPKEYLMLAGRGQAGVDYRRMYEASIKTAEKHLFFRPMTKKAEDVLLSGNVAVRKQSEINLDPEGQHLACFLGGMVGLGAKVFDLAGQMDIAKRLVRGCVWAYRAMPTGLMPEVFHTMPCHVGVDQADPSECAWNETRWRQAVLEYHRLDEQAQPPTETELTQFIKARRLQPGFTDIGDKRYLMR
jgi:mannosyl-oligosaccharide alpha-1,2-mannosidase